MPTLIPFDVDKALKGYPVVTRDGRTINNLKDLAFPELPGEQYFTAIVDDKPVIWDGRGFKDYTYDTPDGLDLFMQTPPTYKWAVTATMLDTDPNDSDYTPVILVDLP